MSAMSSRPAGAHRIVGGDRETGAIRTGPVGTRSRGATRSAGVVRRPLAALLGLCLAVGLLTVATSVAASAAPAAPAQDIEAAAVVRDAAGNYQAYVSRPDHRIYAMKYAGGAWSAATAISGPVRGAPAVVSRPALDRLDLFVIGVDGRLYHGRVTNGRWIGWQGTGIGGLGTGIAAFAREDGTFRVYAMRSDSRLQEFVTNSGGRWSPSWVLSGPVSGNPAVVHQDGTDRVDVFVVGIDGHLYHRACDNHRWQGWRGVGITGLAPNASAGLLPGGGAQVFARRADGVVLGVGSAGGGWSAPAVMSGVLADVPSVLAEPGLGRVDLFAAGADGHLYQRTLAGRQWGGWHGTGNGQVGTAPAATDGRGLAAALLTRWGGRITGLPGVKADLQATAAGRSIANSSSCGRSVTVDPALLRLLLTTTDSYRIYLNNIVTGHGCDGGQHPLGRAVDYNIVTELSTGRTTNFHSGGSGDNVALDRSFVQSQAALLPPLGGGLGQRYCAGRSGISIPAGAAFFGDYCNHQHVDVRRPARS